LHAVWVTTINILVHVKNGSYTKDGVVDSWR